MISVSPVYRALPHRPAIDGRGQLALGQSVDDKEIPDMQPLHPPLSGKTQLVGLIGWPVSHSVSPAMHNAAFVELGLDWCYVPLPVPVEPQNRIGEAVRGLRALGLRGANVTVPHKQAVMPHLDWLSPAAEAIGAVNTIRVEPDGSLSGDNTDAPGFVADLRDHGVNPAGQRVLVLGAGGSARAIVYGLAEAGCATIALCNRTLDRAQALAAEMAARFPACPMSAHTLPAGIYEVATQVDLVVNTTSLGMTPQVEGLPWPEETPFRAGQVVYDLVYNPPQTRLLRKAAADGAQAIGGLGMLIWQGALAFERWTGKSPSVTTMRRAALRDLRRRGLLLRSPVTEPATIRRATVDDAERIAALTVDVQRLHADALPQLFKAPGPRFLVEELREWLNDANRIFLVAERGAEMVGYLFLEVQQRPESESTYARHRLHIEHIAVKPAYQQQGYGEQLMAAAKAIAQAQGITTISLQVWHFNTKAQDFFASQGFVPAGHTMWIQDVSQD
jgi:shikimate dehydrogenase